MSFAAFWVDSTASRIRFWGAGAPPILISRARGGVELVRSVGSLMGGDRFEVGEVRVDLEAGDRIFVFTDCTYEMTDLSGVRLGLKKLRSVFREFSVEKETVDEVRAALVSYFDEVLAGRNQEDDLTFAVIERKVA